MSNSLQPHGLQRARLPCPSPKSRGLLKLMSIELEMPSNHLILCRPLLFLPSIFPSIKVISSESALLIRWPKSWSFSSSVGPSNEYSGLISFRIDWLDLLAVQGTPKIFSSTTVQKHSTRHSLKKIKNLEKTSKPRPAREVCSLGAAALEPGTQLP